MNWKKPISLFVAVAVLAMAAYGLGRYTAPSLGTAPPVQVCFSPNGGCSGAIIKEIDNAKSEILVQVFFYIYYNCQSSYRSS
jgi:hypothetical protein